MIKQNWKKILRRQEKSGWCGPAVIQMALLAGGIRKQQSQIAKDTYHSWWGTTQQTILAYLSRSFKKLGQKENSKISDVRKLLNKGYVVIADWWDNLDPSDAEGHYSLIVAYDSKKDTVTLADPSSGRGIWEMSREKFESKWYDFLDSRYKMKIKRWLLWIDPKSKV